MTNEKALPLTFRTHFVLDVESDGPCPGLYNMISFGLSSVWEPEKTFSRIVLPVAEDGIPAARNVSGISYEKQIELGMNTADAVRESLEWMKETVSKYGIEDLKRVTIWSDNPAYDWQFWNYSWALSGQPNPAGFSARRIGDLWAGYKTDPLNTNSWKKLRRTAHTHDPADDARGNAEALGQIIRSIYYGNK